MQRVRHLHRRAEQAPCSRKVEVRLVNGSHFHVRRKAVEDREDLLRIFAVALRVSRNKNSLRTEPGSHSQWHSRVHTEFPGSIGSRCHHPPLVPLSTDHHWLALQRWIE